MTRRFCVVCSKPTDELIRNVCVDCFKKETSILKIPKLMHGEVCGSCGARKLRGEWIDPEMEEEKAVHKAAVEALNEAMVVGVKDADVNVELQEVKKSSARVYRVLHEITIEGVVEGVRLGSKNVSTVEVRLGICGDCTRMKSGYFEAVLQVRGDDGLGEESRKKVSGIVRDFMGRGQGRRAFVSKVEELKEGVDYYIGSTKAARKLARALQQKLGGSVSESPKLVGRKGGKDIYRVSFALRLPPQEKN